MKLAEFKSKFIKEKDIEKEVLFYLNSLNITAWKQNSGAIVIREIGRQNRFYKTFSDWQGNSIRGISDIGGVLPGGRSLFIEIKKPKKKATLYQKNFIDNINSLGGLAFVATSIEDVKKVLKNEVYIK